MADTQRIEALQKIIDISREYIHIWNTGNYYQVYHGLPEQDESIQIGISLEEGDIGLSLGGSYYGKSRNNISPDYLNSYLMSIDDRFHVSSGTLTENFRKLFVEQFGKYYGEREARKLGL
ncbi:hypothetical protein KW787_04075 [Candidatus Pacearchaeota archaeon]|nr:hypothetical protein [Candidatus Pacearchaeota archaeon]